MSALPDWLCAPLPTPDEASRKAALARQSRLTKPAGSLGRLEALAVRLAALQARELPQARRVHISVFAADHGVAQEQVSAYPQAVTAQMVRNFAARGAAVTVLARELDASLEVVDLGTATPLPPLPDVVAQRLGPGTQNLSREAAMSAAQLVAALEAGRAAAQRHDCDVFVGGEMGIANTTAATALACVLTGRAAREIAGRGTGVDDAGLARKIAVIDTALRLHAAQCDTPLEALRRLGGFEIAALAGAYIAQAQRRVPSLVDGFIASAAALCALRIAPSLAPWLIAAHRSAEPGHRVILDALDATPLLDLDLRLGEGSGAALAVPLLRAACALHAQMATFDDAGVSRAGA